MTVSASKLFLSTGTISSRMLLLVESVLVLRLRLRFSIGAGLWLLLLLVLLLLLLLPKPDAPTKLAAGPRGEAPWRPLLAGKEVARLTISSPSASTALSEEPWRLLADFFKAGLPHM